MLRTRRLAQAGHTRAARRAAWPTAIVLALIAATFLVVAWQIQAIFVALVGVSLLALAGWAIRHIIQQRRALRALDVDLERAQKDFVEGPVEVKEILSLRHGKVLIHTLQCGGQSFKLKPSDYERVPAEGHVRLHVAPQSRELLRVEVLNDLTR